EESLLAVRNAYGGLAGKVADRGRDFGFCRERLRYLMENLDFHRDDDDDEATPSTHAGELTPSHSPMSNPADLLFDVIRQSATARVVLPDGADDLEIAAPPLLARPSEEHWKLLDKELSARVLAPRGGLHSACINSGDL